MCDNRIDSGNEMWQTLKAKCSVVWMTHKASVVDLANEPSRIVSQFTLLARTRKGTKPDFHGAANPEDASRLYHYFVEKVKAGYHADRVKDGKFQAMMEVALVNDGPVSGNNTSRSLASRC